MTMKEALLSAAWLLVPLGIVHAQRTPPTPAEMAQHEVQRYQTLLSLTSTQQTEALAIFTTEATAAEPLHATEHTLHEAMTAAITSDNAASITQTAAGLGQINGQTLALRSMAEAQLYQLLTAEQRTRFSAIEQGHHGGGGPGGPDHPGGPQQ